MFNKNKSEKNFLSLAKWKRKEKYLELSRKIHNQQMKYKDRRNFYSQILFIEGKCPQWSDCYFLSSKRKDIIYHANIKTCNLEISDSIYFKIFEQVFEESKNEPEDKFWFEPDPDNYKRKKKDKLYISMSEDQKLDIFDGRTRTEEVDFRVNKWYKENKGKYKIHKYCHINTFNSKFGVYLSVCVNKPCLNVPQINEFIQSFYDRGEVEYTEEDPVPQSNLDYSNKSCEFYSTVLPLDNSE